MKRSVFIIIGVALIVILVGIWVYVLFFGSKENVPDTFADLDFADTTDNSVSNTQTNTDPVVDVSGPEALRQLTTKPIAGYQSVFSNNGFTSEVLYIESGTGHVYSIDTTTGAEERISATTITMAMDGVISPDGQYIFVKSGTNGGTTFTVGNLSTTSDELVVTELTEDIVSFSATDENTFFYAVKQTSSVVGKEYDPATHTSETLFTVPFREATIVWAPSTDGTHYAYPKASNKLEGFGYEVGANGLTRLPIDGYGLSLVGNDEFVVFGRQEGQTYETGLYNKTDDVLLPFLISTIPEKCAVTTSATTSIICAGTLNDVGINMPDRWYQGVESFADSIWQIDPTSLTATVIANPLLDVGREIDVVDISVSKDDLVYFINKNDRTLWLLDSDVSNTEVN